MLSKNNIKFINSLRAKKYRNEAGLFIAEGERLIEDIVNSPLQVKAIYHTPKWGKKGAAKFEDNAISEDEMKKISGLSTPSNVLALVEIPDHSLSIEAIYDSLSLALDGVQDPGNMGTIIRLADWFGIDTILCSNDTVDAYSPKVIQSCMGAISRVKIYYEELPQILKSIDSIKLPVYGTFMEGFSIYEEKLSKHGIIVMGNEGNGISPEVEKHISKKIHIPNFANNRTTVESLNVAMAAAVVLSEFRRS
jgi:RNA methyltransferase, TrmH family